MRRGLRLWLPLVGALTVLACPEQNAVWVEEGSSADSLVFGVGRFRDGRGPPLSSVPTFVVLRCTEPDADEDVVWQVVVADSQAPVPDRIRYGTPPVGYHSTVGPQDLAPGCYQAAIVGSGRAAFEIASDGGVRIL